MNIELKKWSFGDRKHLITICNAVDRTYLSNQLPFPYTDEAADWWLDMVSKHDGVDGIFRSITVNGQITGTISVEQKKDVFCKDAEIGYFLCTDYWSRGIATEAVRQICEIAFINLDIIRITGTIFEPNQASRKVLEKNHFILEGIMKNSAVKDSHIYDVRVYAKMK